MIHSRNVLTLAVSALVMVAACSDDATSSGTQQAAGSGGGPGGAGGSSVGGAAGSGGQGGSAGSVSPPTKTDKIDLLLMIDNSASMADKQQILAEAVPDLVNRLVNPACVDGQGTPVAQQPAKPLDPCPTGSAREFNPVFDIHVGVITSSLGGHGADMCSNTPTSMYNPRMEDMAHLIARMPGDASQSVPTWQNKGFLNWDPTQAASPPGDSDIPGFIAKFSQIVLGAAQDGCGFEAPLEAWYRFLVEPEPYKELVKVDCATSAPDPAGACRGPSGVDATLLQQRADFLRQDSLVAIVMLTDEDDCSVQDGSQNYIIVQGYAGNNAWHMPRATSACATDPGSPSCKSCAQGDPGNDPSCAQGPYSDLEDALNLRCYRQKQRFGMDFLYPTQRYVDGLSNSTLNGGRVNPLFCKEPSSDGKSCTTATRNPGHVVIAGIVGVPWQDIARDPSDLTKGYKAATELDWDLIAGDLNSYVDPKDPLMVPSIDPRSGTNPATGQALAPSSASSPTANSINGHEWNIPMRNDLQYACVFPLPTPKQCQANPVACDCSDPGAANNPLCQNDQGAYGTTQYRAKAYPAPRVLTVLKGVAPRAAVASICAANVANPAAADFGYRPAIAALLERMRPSL